MCWWWWLEIDPYFPVMRTKGKKWPDIYCIKMHFIQYVCTLHVAWHGRCVRCGCSCSHHQHVASFYMQKLMDYCGSTIHLLLLIFCDLNIAHLIPPFQGWTITSTRLVVVITHAAAPVVTCQAAPAQLMDYLAIWTRGHVDTRRHGDTETWIHGYADNITHDCSHRAPGSWHNGLGLCRSLVTVQI